MLKAGTGDSSAELDKPMVPVDLEQALDPLWLRKALAPISGGSPVIWVGTIDKLETMAAKVRFEVRFENEPDVTHALCLKAFLSAEKARTGGATAVREAKFYLEVAPHLTMRLPSANAIIDHEANRAILIMEDLIVAGAQFCSAHEPFTIDLAVQSLDQIARLHSASMLLDSNHWIPIRLAYLATAPHFTAPQLQELMDGSRGKGMSNRTRDASLLLKGMKVLAQHFASRPMAILHGDCHAGNFYLTADGPGLTDWQLIQRGNWAQDVAYHIAAVLPVEVAEREERALLDHYLDAIRKHGGTPPDRETAWDDYRAAQIYGYYHWAITTKVEPEIIDIFVHRLGAGVARHDTYNLLGL
jgi:hypothetical protein